jgi:hypothetical protein
VPGKITELFLQFPGFFLILLVMNLHLTTLSCCLHCEVCACVSTGAGG